MKKVIRSILSVLLAASLLLPCVPVLAADDASDEAVLLEQWQQSRPDETEKKFFDFGNMFKKGRAEEQSISDYNHLRNYLLRYGDRDGDFCYLSRLKYSDDTPYFYIISYSSATDEMIFGGRLVGGSINVYFKITPDYSDGYFLTIGSDFGSTSGGTVYGSATVFPASYVNSLSFTVRDAGGKVISDAEAVKLFNYAFTLCVAEWNDILMASPKITLGNFGFTKLIAPAAIPGGEYATTVTIRNRSNITVDYGTELHISAFAQNLPDGAYLFWLPDPGEGIVLGDSAVFKCWGSCTLYAAIADSNGNILTDVDGNEIFDCEVITVRSGFFQKLLYFFRNLFGIVKTYTQS